MTAEKSRRQTGHVRSSGTFYDNTATAVYNIETTSVNNVTKLNC